VHGDYGYIEDEHQGSVYNFRLLKRLFPYALSFKKHVLIILLVTLLGTLLNLTLPYITKLAMDDYIVAGWSRLNTNVADPALLKEFERARPGMIQSGKSGEPLFIAGSTFRGLPEKTRERWEEKGLLSRERYYRVAPDKADNPAVTRHADLFIRSGQGLFISYDDLFRLDRSEIKAIRAEDIRGVGVLALFYLAILAVMFLLNYSEYYFAEYVGQGVMQAIRVELFGHLLKQGMKFFDRNAVGRLVTRVTNDVQNLDETFKSIIGALCRDLFVLVGIIIVLLGLNWRLALVCFTLTPVIFALAFLFSRLARGAFRELRARLATINGYLQESFSGMKVIQAFHREAVKMNRFRDLNHKAYLAGMRQIKVFALFMPAIEACASIAVALMIWYGGLRVLSDQMSLGSLAAFMGYMAMFFRPIRDLAERYNTMQSAMASSERIFGYLDTHDEIPGPDNPPKPPLNGGTIEFRDVTFGYEPEHPVLKGISFTVNAGETVAIVGRTGAGKTSIISLLERFYQPWSGAILVDGLDIRQWAPDELRKRLGLVLQDVFLFAGDVAENLTLGRDGVSAEDLERICVHVNADRFIRKLPLGYAQPVREGGSILSAGQRQLLSSARALVLNPQILVLDEATSNVDPESERLIQDAFTRLMKERTTLVIAHRLSTIRKASKILVMHHGEIKERGTHEELMALRGLYYRLNRIRETAS